MSREAGSRHAGKTKTIFKTFILLALVVVTTLALVTPVLAQQSADNYQEGLGSGVLPNFSRTDSVEGIIAIVVNALLAIASTIAVIFIIIGGYRYITAGSSTDAASSAKKTLVWAIAGLVTVILSAVLVNTLISIFS